MSLSADLVDMFRSESETFYLPFMEKDSTRELARPCCCVVVDRRSSPMLRLDSQQCYTRTRAPENEVFWFRFTCLGVVDSCYFIMLHDGRVAAMISGASSISASSLPLPGIDLLLECQAESS